MISEEMRNEIKSLDPDSVVDNIEMLKCLIEELEITETEIKNEIKDSKLKFILKKKQNYFFYFTIILGITFLFLFPAIIYFNIILLLKEMKFIVLISLIGFFYVLIILIKLCDLVDYLKLLNQSI